MKLYIRRMQAEKKGLLGGHKGMGFKFFARVELSESDKALIEKYKLWDYVMARYKTLTPDKREEIEWEITTKAILDGYETR